MVRLSRLAVLLFLLMSWAAAQDITRFRFWMGGQEVGGQEMVFSRNGKTERFENREWARYERLGTVVEQKINQTAIRNADGRMEFKWSLRLSQELIEGRALWDPAMPRKLRILSNGLPEALVELEEGWLIWPGDAEVSLKEAARLRRSVCIKGYAPVMQQQTEIDLRIVGPDPLPGFPDAIRFQSRRREGPMVTDGEVWISPLAGELKEMGQTGGMPILIQRAELPSPDFTSQQSFFARTLNTLPPHPFLAWIPEAVMRWQGQGEQRLPEDDQQKAVGPNGIRLTRALPPNDAEAAQMPVKGKLTAEEAPCLAPSPLVPFQDPVFDGLLARLRAPANATRWQLAKAVNHFVFDWITEKDFTVGFASALEVARRPRGDCTEHGVLAVALLRKLGVPARGALGWIGASGVMGLHFWVEVNLKGRWVPIDPTFDEAPASTLHLKLGTTELANLGSVGWDTAATQFVGGSWVPERPWAEAIRIEIDRVIAPGGERLGLLGAKWELSGGVLTLRWRGVHGVEAVPPPHAQVLKGARVFESAHSHRRAWWNANENRLWIRLDAAHWLQVSALDQPAALALLDQLEWLPCPKQP